ncbi:uncharacterized protein I303_104915 [Kwoniella dejecticola CBS 10117]|uniref:Uncharacterized protein n=1 Tax=Kwoniella dejecticola CBS 10117 TaxID=1296121 RepID=A0A1A6A3Z5_9TREE|nr:uncharacterized protein I303_05639 [Kwoniella dejecticola CBS 10117]OBR84780.1 hypothetical protein I303_05639 [Kwoniella dejecticola CBS 10117]
MSSHDYGYQPDPRYEGYSHNPANKDPDAINCDFAREALGDDYVASPRIASSNSMSYHGAEQANYEGDRNDHIDFSFATTALGKVAYDPTHGHFYNQGSVPGIAVHQDDSPAEMSAYGAHQHAHIGCYDQSSHFYGSGHEQQHYQENDALQIPAPSYWDASSDSEGYAISDDEAQRSPIGQPNNDEFTLQTGALRHATGTKPHEDPNSEHAEPTEHHDTVVPVASYTSTPWTTRWTSANALTQREKDLLEAPGNATGKLFPLYGLFPGDHSSRPQTLKTLQPLKTPKTNKYAKASGIPWIDEFHAHRGNCLSTLKPYLSQREYDALRRVRDVDADQVDGLIAQLDEEDRLRRQCGETHTAPLSTQGMTQHDWMTSELSQEIYDKLISMSASSFVAIALCYEHESLDFKLIVRAEGRKLETYVDSANGETRQFDWYDCCPNVKAHPTVKGRHQPGTNVYAKLTGIPWLSAEHVSRLHPEKILEA